MTPLDPPPPYWAKHVAVCCYAAYSTAPFMYGDTCGRGMTASRKLTNEERTMKVTTARTITVEMTEQEANDLASAVRNATAAFQKLPMEDRDFLATHKHTDKLLAFATALTHAPR